MSRKALQKAFSMKKSAIALSLILCLFAAWRVFNRGGAEYRDQGASYAKATRLLRERVWNDMRETFYCGAAFDAKGNIILPDGFSSPGHKARSARLEWEHAVPVENFGRFFKEWREGDPACVKKGRPYKGRGCASKMSAKFREMEADMHNLFPSIGSVNAMRGKRQYAELPDEGADFGSCAAKIKGSLFEPPDRAKGQAARASLYMDWKYPGFRLSRKQKRLFAAWDKRFPPDAKECERARRIQRIQNNENIFVTRACEKAGL